jgi:hypothetical protein
MTTREKLAAQEIGRNRVELWFVPEGTEIVAGAGSYVREDDGWLARVTDGATSHGHWYDTLEEAQEKYDRLVAHEIRIAQQRILLVAE